jgi:hypothetical protein
MKSLVKSLLPVVCWGALGCGGESDSGKHVDTGLAEATALRDVTSAQSVSACQNVRSAVQAEFTVDENVRSACELYGAALTATPEECQSQADGCVTQTDNGTNSFIRREQLDFGASLPCDGDVSGFAGCAVTVGEYEDCVDARIAQTNQLFAQFSCARAASIELGDAQGFVAQLTNPETPSACERLLTECPQADPFASGGN